MSDKNDDPHLHTRRDAETFWVLGLFLVILSVAVLIGTFYAERFHAMVVNVIAGLILLATGIAMVWRGVSLSRHIQ